MNTYFEAVGRVYATAHEAIDAAKRAAAAHGKWELVIERNGGTPVKHRGVQGGGRVWMVGPQGQVERDTNIRA